MRAFLILLFCFLSAFADTQTWDNGNADNDMNNVLNWSGDSAWSATDTLSFDGVVDDAATASAQMDVGVILFSTGYSGAFNDGGQAFNIVGDLNVNTGGTFTATGTWTQSGNANFVLTAASSWTTTAWSIDLQGTGGLQNNTGGSRTIKLLTCAANTKTITFTANATLNVTQLTLGAGTLTITNATLTANCMATNDLTFNASHTISGNGQLNLYTGATITLNIPKINASVLTGGIQIFANYASTQVFDIMGDINCGGFFRMANNAGFGNSATTFNTNNYAITVAGEVRLGSGADIASTTYNFGSSVIDFNGAFQTTLYNTDSCIINLGTSTWTVAGDFDLGTKTGIVRGTSDITFDGTTAVTPTLAGQQLYDVTVAKTGGGFTSNGAFSCNDFVVSAANNQNTSFSGTTLTAGGDVLWDGSGSPNLGQKISCSGNATTVHLGSTLGTITASSCSLNVTGLKPVVDVDKATTFKACLYSNDAGDTTTISGAALITSEQLTLGAGHTIFNQDNTTVCNSQLDLVFNPAATIFIADNKILYIRHEVVSGTQTWNLPKITATSSGATGGSIYFYNNWGSTLTMSMTEAISFTGGHTLRFYNAGAAATNLTTNNYNITCPIFLYGTNSNTTGTMTMNLGSSTITAINYFDNHDDFYYHGDAGTIVNATNATIDVGAGTEGFLIGHNRSWSGGTVYAAGIVKIDTGVTLTTPVNLLMYDGSGTQTTTSNGKQLADSVFINSSGTVTLADSAYARAWNINAGTFALGTNKLKATNINEATAADISWSSGAKLYVADGGKVTGFDGDTLPPVIFLGSGGL